MKSKRSVVELFLDDPEPLVEEAALAIAADAYPELDRTRCIDQLDALGRRLAARTDAGAPVGDQLDALRAVVYEEEGFAGNEADYHDPRNSYLNEVLARRTGLPITLAVVLLAMCRRAGLVAEGVSFPGHFLVRLGGSAGVYVDPFFDGRELDEPALRALAARALGEGASVRREHLAPVGCLAITARMLTNLARVYARHGDHARAMVACDRLADLTGAPEFVRDRGLHALHLGALSAARHDLARYLERRPSAGDVDAVRAALRRAEAGARSMQ